MSQLTLSPGLQVGGPGPVAAVNGTGSNSTGNTGPLYGNGLQSILIGEIAPLPLPAPPHSVAFLSIGICAPSVLQTCAHDDWERTE